jgi:hypothetical protein
MVPPTLSVPFNAEKLVEHRARMDEFRAELISLWNGTLKDEIKTGAFRRTQIFDWQLPYDGLLQTYFIYPKAATSKGQELARIASLFKRETCQLLGSVVIWGTDYVQYIPKAEKSDSVTRLKESAQRLRPSARSPVRLTSEGHSYWGTSLAWITESILGEQLASKDLVVHSDLSGLACLRAKSVSKSVGEDKVSSVASTSKDPAFERNLRRGHRQVRLVIEGSKASNSQLWPSVKARYTFIPLPLNVQLAERRGGELTSAEFSPRAIGQSIAQNLESMLHDLNEPSIPIINRDGKFVTVERGLAFGLRIGMHLEGPQGEKLHVIRFDKSRGMVDAAILLIRNEKNDSPLKVGDQLKIDESTYPAQ